MSEPQNAPQCSQGAARASILVCRRQDCQKPFTPYRPWQTHCSDQCRRAEDREIRQAGRQQLGLALDNPIARATDPVTSHIAAHAVTESGSRASHCALVFEVLRVASGPMTYREVARHLPKLEPAEVMRRLNDLRHEEPARVEQLERRKCRVSGRSAQTWQAVSRVVPQENAA